MLLFVQQLEKPAHIWSRGGEGPFETVLLLSGTAFLWQCMKNLPVCSTSEQPVHHLYPGKSLL